MPSEDSANGVIVKLHTELHRERPASRTIVQLAPLGLKQPVGAILLLIIIFHLSGCKRVPLRYVD